MFRQRSHYILFSCPSHSSLHCCSILTESCVYLMSIITRTAFLEAAPAQCGQSLSCVHPTSVHVWKNVPSAAHACSCLWLTDALYMTHQLGTAGCLLLHCLHHGLSCCTEPWGVVGWACRTPKYRSRLMSGRSFCPAPPYLMSGSPPGCMPTLQKWLPGPTRTSRMCFTPARSCTHGALHTACKCMPGSNVQPTESQYCAVLDLAIIACTAMLPMHHQPLLMSAFADLQFGAQMC